jgi:hypothetical protein
MKNKLKFELNDAQLDVVIQIEFGGKKVIYLEWGRGTGKSFILAYIMLRMVQQMPGASFAFVGPTYQQILATMLPSTKNALKKLNIFENIDYVIGKDGTKLGYDAPIYAPDKWNNIMHWSNGCTFQFVSMDNTSSGRGLNSFGEVGDEAVLFDPVKLYNNVTITNRAKEERFEGCSLFGAKIYASSTAMTKRGKWFTDKEEFCKLPENRKTHYFIKASAEVNMHNLQDGYLEQIKAEAPSELHYRAEILNERPTEILDGFYPQLKPRHYYVDEENDYLVSITGNYTKASFNCKQDCDIDKSRPLILSIDWGTFSGAIVQQKLPNKHRTLKEFWASQQSESKDEEDLINDFVDYYAPLPNKTVHLYYGHDGNAKVKKGTNETYGDVLVALLQKKGWTVYDKSKRKPVAPHNDKYILINMMLKQSSSRYPAIEINEYNCPNLIIGLERAEAKEGKNGIEKVKKDERNSSMNQAHTTHLPDAFDIPIYSIYKHLLKPAKEYWDLPTTM